MTNIYTNLQTNEILNNDILETLADNAMLKVKPELWEELDLVKNRELNIDYLKITRGSKMDLYWICKNCSSEHSNSPLNKIKSKSCAYCRGFLVNETNSLFHKNHELAMQVHPYKNGELSSKEVYYKTSKKIWWKCDNGHEWESVVLNRNNGVGCPYCSKNLSTYEYNIVTEYPQIASEINIPKNNNIDPYTISPYSNLYLWWKGTCGHEWYSRICGRTNGGNGCPYCANQKVLKGFNDINTTNVKVSKLLLNYEDGYTITQYTKERLYFKCHNCNRKSKKRVADVSFQGFSCNYCADGISLPEKMMYSLLDSLGIDFEYQKSFNFSKNRLYDFYIPSKNTIIETHGGQHFNGGFDTTLEYQQAVDKEKYNYAINNVDNYIVINCSISEVEFIKHNIINSNLSKVLDLTNVDWETVFNSVGSSMVVKACDLWNTGNYTSFTLSKKMRLCKQTIIKYLKIGNSLKLCNYSTSEEINKNKINLSHKVYVYDLNNNLMYKYDSINKGYKDLNLSYARLSKLCKNEDIYNGLKYSHKELIN